MESVIDLQQQQQELTQQALNMFLTMCTESKLNETSTAQLLGVSRQTLVNYKKGTVPCRGVAARIKMVVPLIKAAHETHLLPAAQVRKQGELVRAILSQPK